MRPLELVTYFRVETEELNEEELIAAVNESAEQGLAFFGNLLGLAFGNPEVNATNGSVPTTEANTNTESSTITPQVSRNTRALQMSTKYNQV